jgi:hypothetical protein
LSPGRNPEGEDALPNQKIDNSTTRATARLPGLEVEIIHRRLPGADAEQLLINLQAVPSFEAFGQFQAANPFAFWAQAVKLVWFHRPRLVQGILNPAFRGFNTMAALPPESEHLLVPKASGHQSKLRLSAVR